MKIERRFILLSYWKTFSHNRGVDVVLIFAVTFVISHHSRSAGNAVLVNSKVHTYYHFPGLPTTDYHIYHSSQNEVFRLNMLHDHNIYFKHHGICSSGIPSS